MLPGQEAEVTAFDNGFLEGSWAAWALSFRLSTQFQWKFCSFLTSGFLIL